LEFVDVDFDYWRRFIEIVDQLDFPAISLCGRQVGEQ
jgi:hypothetical protein